MSVRTDLRLFLQAVNRGWDVPEEAKAKAKAMAEAVLADSQSSKRERTTAELVLSKLGVGPPHNAQLRSVDRSQEYHTL